MGRLKRYKALSLETCMQAARRDFGPDAMIHAVRTRREGFLLFGRRTIHELLAGPASDIASIAAAGTTPRVRSVRGAAALRAYAPAANDAANAAARAEPIELMSSHRAADSAPLAISENRTRLLAQAMAIRLERDAHARRLAQANERATHAESDSVGTGGTAEAAAEHITSTAERFVLVPAARAESWAREQSQRVQVIEAPLPIAMAQMSNEMRSLRALVERVIRARASGRDMEIAEELLASPAPWCDALDAARVGAPLAGFYATLIGQSMASELARRIVEEAHEAMSAGDRSDPEAARRAVRTRIAALLPPCESTPQLRGRNGRRPHIVSLVGPTGTGKTTTIAKLAAEYALRQGLRVGLVTTDTFRIAAVEQLRTYAEIVGLPLHVAENAAGVRRACDGLADRDVILVDTAGRGHSDRVRLDELGTLVRAAMPDETHLVLASTAGERTLLAEAAAFAEVGVDRVVVAKLDEAVGFGVLLGALARIRRPLSWMTTGQEVPDDIEPARGDRLADLVLGGAANE